jgi:hypothetical protein
VTCVGGTSNSVWFSIVCVAKLSSNHIRVIVVFIMLVVNVYFVSLIPKKPKDFEPINYRGVLLSTCYFIRCLHNFLNLLVHIANKIELQRKASRVLWLAVDGIFYTIICVLCIEII